MEIAIGIIGLIVGIVIAIIPYYRSKYILRPEVTIEMISDGGISSPRGFSSKNKVNEEGYIDRNTAIRIFELTWRFKIKITNNSELTAFYPELEFNPNRPKFKIVKINRLEPIKPAESLELNAEFTKYEEATGKDRTKIGQAPPIEFKDLELLFGYENSKKRRFYTLFDFNSEKNKNQFLRNKPKDYKTTSHNNV